MGGLLGLFMGFSVITVAEVVYYLLSLVATTLNGTMLAVGLSRMGRRRMVGVSVISSEHLAVGSGDKGDKSRETGGGLAPVEAW